MDNKDIEKVLFNYFLNTTSYVKTVLDFLSEEEVSKEKKAYIVEMFNYIFNSLNKEELMDVVKISNLFQEKLSLMSHNEAKIEALYIYKNFFEKMLFDSYNRGIYFSILNECIKVSVGYYQVLNDSNFYQINDNAVSNIHIK